MAGVVMASDIDASGLAVEPALTFDPKTERITAIVSLDEVEAGQTVTIAWNRVIGLERRDRLFEHTVEAQPSSSAFSIGLSPGELEEGSYEVVATLGEHEVWTPWSVTAASIPVLPAAKGKAGPDAMELVGFVAQEEPDTVGPPEPGESGTEPWFDEEPEAEPGPCTGVQVEGSLRDMLIISARASQVGDCQRVTLGGRMAGGEWAVVDRGPDAANGTFEPCQLPAGSDLPGEVVEVGGAVPEPDIGDVIDRVELDEFPLPPFVEVWTNPPSGSTVKEGDTIEWVAVAVQIPAVGAVEGIRSLEARGPEGVLDTMEREQRACDEERFVARLPGTPMSKGSYSVPEDPPPLIELTAHAEDFEGRPGSNAAYFSKEGLVWQGTLDWTIEGHPTTEVLFLGVVGLNVGEDGTIVGRMTGSGFTVVLLPGAPGPQPFTWACELGGRREAMSMMVELHSCRTNPPTPTAEGTVTLAITDKTATGTQSVPPYSSLKMDLRCTSC